MTESESIVSFLNSSKSYAKNPLGIIALFISLIYGFACLVLGLTGKTLNENERLILILFLVIFPLFILISFMFLVTKHYRKLYAPSDFRDEKNYLETIDIISQKSRIQNQVIESKGQVESIPTTPKTDNRINKYRDYLIVENLILRIVEKDYNLPLRRNVKFKGHECTFDCIIEGKDIFVGVEIKYYYNIEDKHIETISLHLRRRFHTFQRISKDYYPNKKRVFLLYIVYDNNITNFKDNLTKLFENDNSLEVNIRFYEYENVLNRFGFDK